MELQHEEGIHIPFGNIDCEQKDKITEMLYHINDDKAFTLLRDIICCVYNYTGNMEDINKYVDIFTKDNKNLSLDNIYNTMLSLKTNWYEIFSKSCDYNKIYNKLSHSPDKVEFNNNILRAIPRSKDLGISPECIMYLHGMYALIHSTSIFRPDLVDNKIKVGINIDHVKSIFKDGYLKIGDRTEQFPGVYTSLATDNNFGRFDDDEMIYFILPLYLLKSKAWHANIIESYGTICETTVDSYSFTDYVSAVLFPNFEEIVFHYDISIEHIIHVVCSENMYDILYPIIGDKLITTSQFVRRRYTDNLFIHNDYNRGPLRLDYAPNQLYNAQLSLKSLYNILLNINGDENKSKRLVRKHDREDLMLAINDLFWKNYKQNIIPKVISHPPW